MDIPAGEIVNYSFMVDYSDWNSGESPWLEFTVNSSGQILTILNQSLNITLNHLRLRVRNQHLLGCLYW